MAASTPTKDGTRKPMLDIDFISQAMVFIPSERCTISCGTICVDPSADKVLIIFNRRLGIWQLPKGRKNIGECLQSAALRETYEETGVHASLFPLKIRTRSTQSSATPILPSANAYLASGTGAIMASCRARDLDVHIDGPHVPNSSHNATPIIEHDTLDHDTSPTTIDLKLTRNLLNSELIGIVQYPDLQAATVDTTKTVFFYAAVADSTAPLGPGAREDHEDLIAEWVNFREAGKRLRFRPEQEAVCKLEDDMKR
ncbi:nudix hydrolase [Grosmannia clavigera kw1407]|uniref:Nudix hydrolase n=1 Tax=Grosmannia clavigera (strain kw1407 / UAMH 11150) TaxID=655863 RepID=F0XJY1_GROCL|nr:nudix hydrolase [Grosmannia clavigera kw1407]EFX02014.1 nudix hydrolase [Grosmannia clavigera kw1407]